MLMFLWEPKWCSKLRRAFSSEGVPRVAWKFKNFGNEIDSLYEKGSYLKIKIKKKIWYMLSTEEQRRGKEVPSLSDFQESPMLCFPHLVLKVAHAFSRYTPTEVPHFSLKTIQIFNVKEKCKMTNEPRRLVEVMWSPTWLPTQPHWARGLALGIKSRLSPLTSPSPAPRSPQRPPFSSS